MDDEAKEQVEFEGRPVRIGNRQYMLPSLSVGQAERLWPALLKLDKEGVTEDEVKAAIPSKFNDMIDIIHAALSRNYKDVTIAQLKEIVSIGQLKQLMLVVTGQSGIEVSSQPGEPAPVREKRAVH